MPRAWQAWPTPRGDAAFSSGVLPDSTASLLVRVRDGRVLVAMTTRMVPAGLIHAHVLRAVGCGLAGAD
jgi:hypothetical protein